LPIELFDFVATAMFDGRVKLQWTTVTEINNDFFSVEHSVSDMEFVEIFQTAGAGTTTVKIEYEEIHENPDQGINYYRLKQTDFDGTFTYSKVVSATVTTLTGTLVYPNPITENWYVKFSGDAGEHKLLEVFDLTGRKLMEHQTQGEQLVELSRKGILNGSYVLRITSAVNTVGFIKINFH
jgi:hypothetical protein